MLSTLPIRLTLRPRKPGFSLVEVVIALGLVSFCFVGVIGLLPVGLNQQSKAVQSTRATQLAMAVASDLRSFASSQNGASNSGRYHLPISGGTALTNTIFASDAMELLPSANGASYRVTCGQIPTGAGTLEARQIHIVVTWPAVSNATVGGRVETLVALDLFGKP